MTEPNSILAVYHSQHFTVADMKATTVVILFILLASARAVPGAARQQLEKFYAQSADKLCSTLEHDQPLDSVCGDSLLLCNFCGLHHLLHDDSFIESEQRILDERDKAIAEQLEHDLELAALISSGASSAWTI